MKDIVTRFSNLFPDQQALQTISIAYRIGSISTVKNFTNTDSDSDDQSE